MIEPPAPPVGEDAPPELAAGDAVHPAQIAQHLGRGRRLLAAAARLPVERSPPAFGFDDGEAEFVALPLVVEAVRPHPGLRALEQQAVRHVVASAQGEVLVAKRALPAQPAEDGPDQVVFGLAYIRSACDRKTPEQRRQIAGERAGRAVVEGGPLRQPGDRVAQEVIGKQVALERGVDHRKRISGGGRVQVCLAPTEVDTWNALTSTCAFQGAAERGGGCKSRIAEETAGNTRRPRPWASPWRRSPFLRRRLRPTPRCRRRTFSAARRCAAPPRPTALSGAGRQRDGVEAGEGLEMRAAAEQKTSVSPFWRLGRVHTLSETCLGIPESILSRRGKRLVVPSRWRTPSHGRSPPRSRRSRPRPASMFV